MSDFFSKLNPLAFLIAFSIGIFMCYITKPEPTIIFKHPTPENAGTIIYHDNDNNCYKYVAEEVKCPSNNNEITQTPLNISI
jgi:hypothetical protein